jgi:hypothetical protein
MSPKSKSKPHSHTKKNAASKDKQKQYLSKAFSIDMNRLHSISDKLTSDLNIAFDSDKTLLNNQMSQGDLKSILDKLILKNKDFFTSDNIKGLNESKIFDEDNKFLDYVKSVVKLPEEEIKPEEDITPVKDINKNLEPQIPISSQGGAGRERARRPPEESLLRDHTLYEILDNVYQENPSESIMKKNSILLISRFNAILMISSQLFIIYGLWQLMGDEVAGTHQPCGFFGNAIDTLISFTGSPSYCRERTITNYAYMFRYFFFIYVLSDAVKVFFTGNINGDMGQALMQAVPIIPIQAAASMLGPNGLLVTAGTALANHIKNLFNTYERSTGLYIISYLARKYPDSAFVTYVNDNGITQASITNMHLQALLPLLTPGGVELEGQSEDNVEGGRKSRRRNPKKSRKNKTKRYVK